MTGVPSRTRPVANDRCKDCLNEAVVYQDTNLCYWCDPANYEEIERRERELDGD